MRILYYFFICLLVSCSDAGEYNPEVPGSTETSSTTSEHVAPDSTKEILYQGQEVSSYIMDMFDDTINVKTVNLDSSSGAQLIAFLESDTLTKANTSSVCGQPFPTTLKELNQRDQYSTNVTKAASGNLSLFGITSGRLKRGEQLVVSDFIKYRSYTCDKEYKVGVGFRLYIHVKNVKGDINVTELKELSAAVQLKRAQATFRLKIFGLENDELYQNLPAGAFGVDTYAKIETAFNILMKGLTGETKIDPIIIKDIIEM